MLGVAGSRKIWWFGALILLAVAGAIVGNAMTCGSGHDEPSATARGSADGRNAAVRQNTHPTSANAAEPEDPPGNLRLEGQVIDEQQQPVVGADVTLWPSERHAISDTSGSFAFDKLIKRRYQLAARKDDLYAGVSRVRLFETSEPVTLRMRLGAKLVVHVMEDRAPIEGALVILDDQARATSDRSGTATIGGVGPHFHHVEVTADGRAPARMSLMLGDDAGGIVDRTVTLHHGASLSGVVVGPDGKQVTDATVQVDAGEWSGRATSDGAGAWRFDALGAGKVSLSATSKALGPAPDVEIELDGVTPRRDIVVHVAVDAQLIGTVTDASGTPIAGATVIASDSTRRPYPNRSGTDGRFEFLGIKAGTYELVARTDSQASPSTHVTIANDQRAEAKLVVQDSGIAGTVVDAKGTPIPEARVSAMPDGRVSMANFSNDITDSRGHFNLGGLEPGDYRLDASWPNQTDRRVGAGEHVKAGNRNVKLVLETPATVTGRVLLDGSPVTSYGLLLTDHPEFSSNGAPSGIHAADGRFTLRGIQSGRWGIVLIAPGTARKTIDDIKIEQGKTTDLGNIALSHGQRISGHVRDSAGSLVAGATVTFGLMVSGLDAGPLERSFRGQFQTTTNEAGGYAFDGIAPLGNPRADQISAAHPDRGASPPSSVPVGDGVVDLVLAATGGIDGTVEGSAESLGIVNASTTSDRGGRLTARVDRSGAFHFDGLPAGDYTLSMFPLPGRTGPAPASVTVVANQRAKAKLVVPNGNVTLIVKISGGTCTGVMLMPPGDGPFRWGDYRGFASCSGDTAEFDGVEPGSYRVCAGAVNCTPVTVLPAPEKQTVQVQNGSGH